MKKWYKESYFNGINWILENYDKLNLSADEALVLMLIELANRNNRALSYDYLRAKLGYDNNRIDSIGSIDTPQGNPGRFDCPSPGAAASSFPIRAALRHPSLSKSGGAAPPVRSPHRGCAPDRGRAE